MAYTDLVSVQVQIQLVQGLQIEIAFPTKDSNGAGIDITSWSGFVFNVYLQNPDGTITTYLSSTPTLTGGTGQALLLLSSADTSKLVPGAFSYVLAGHNGPSDDNQLISRASLLSYLLG